MSKRILLDRDGTIIVDKHYLHDPHGVELLPHAAEGLKLLTDAGFVLTVISNQSGIGRGYFSGEDADAVNLRLEEILAGYGVSVSGFYYCPHAPGEHCRCRKPATGLVLQASETEGFDLSEVVAVVGDKMSDIGLAKNLGVTGILITDEAGPENDFFCTPDLLCCARRLINEVKLMNGKQCVEDNIAAHFEVARKMGTMTDDIAQAAGMMTECLRKGGHIYFCGNGGSAADAQHIAAELSGRYLLNRHALAAEALHCNTSALTAIANDFGYDEIFARQVEAHGRPGDILFGISTSGNSANIVKAVKKAREMGMKTIAATGYRESELSALADLTLRVPSSETPRIQEMHILIGHTVCEIIERNLFEEV